MLSQKRGGIFCLNPYICPIKNAMIDYPAHGSKYFDLRELVDQRTWGILGYKCASLIDPKIVVIIDLVRELSGMPTTVNNWHFAKPGETVYNSSGFRAIWDKTGGLLSQHRCGRAADVKVRGLIPAQVHALINANAKRFERAGLTTMESLEFTRSWSHLDCRPKVSGWHPEDGFLIVKP